MNNQKILVAEDDRFLASGYKAKLTKSGYQVLEAKNGQETLDQMKFMPDLIILDLIMPDIDGFEVLKKIKSDPRYKHIPVLVASNLAQTGDIDLSLSLGAAEYIVKSDLTMSGLIDKIKKLIKTT